MKWSKKQIEDSIHLRMVKFAISKPGGFSYAEIGNHYRNRPKEWKVIHECLVNAFRNKAALQNVETPFVVLEQAVTDNNVTTATYTVSSGAFFNYLDYLELVEARKNARNASRTAFGAIGLSILSLGASIYFSIKQINSQTQLETGQYQHLIETIKGSNN